MLFDEVLSNIEIRLKLFSVNKNRCTLHQINGYNMCTNLNVQIDIY